MLSVNDTLSSLSLSENNIENIDELANGLSYNVALKELYLNNNQIKNLN